MQPMDVDISCKLAGIPLSCCLLNASGPRSKSFEQLAAVAGSWSGAVVSKSATLNERLGNDLPRYTEVPLGDRTASVNSEGLPNHSLSFYTEALVRLREVSPKPFILSISGLSLDENLQMLDYLEQSSARAHLSAVEVNVACPNVPGKPLVGYDLPQLAEVVRRISEHRLFRDRVLGLKLPPYLDAPFFDQVANMLNPLARAKGGSLGYVVCCNTLGSALAVDVDSEATVLHPKGGFGGAGGALVRLLALGNVRHFRQRLDASIAVVGCGGVASGEDAFALILCGATCVQVATQHHIEGSRCFQRIAAELQQLMRRKGYLSLADFRGKLRVAAKL
ncbi:unnamed protein product [Effrenium voratum]|uniref:Dihydroorotate oxidase n=1 Tax=Effrenium voratum TaxID=2562239 RepID=A0AA36J212_9DINO|nr:unnamed protein product [Effrenium voratum]